MRASRSELLEINFDPIGHWLVTPELTLHLKYYISSRPNDDYYVSLLPDETVQFRQGSLQSTPTPTTGHWECQFDTALEISRDDDSVHERFSLIKDTSTYQRHGQDEHCLLIPVKLELHQASNTYHVSEADTSAGIR